MIVADVFIIKGRGPVATMENDTEVRHEGALLRRASDGATWSIRGVERFGKFSGRPTLGVGEKVGILLPLDADVKTGDEVEIVTP